MSFVKKILKDPKEFQVFPHSCEKRTRGERIFLVSTLSYYLLHEARKYEPREGEGGEENRGSYERSNVCKHLSCMW